MNVGMVTKITASSPVSAPIFPTKYSFCTKRFEILKLRIGPYECLLKGAALPGEKSRSFGLLRLRRSSSSASPSTTIRTTSSCSRTRSPRPLGCKSGVNAMVFPVKSWPIVCKLLSNACEKLTNPKANVVKFWQTSVKGRIVVFQC